MSPTSYQAAPPRESIIAEAVKTIKPSSRAIENGTVGDLWREVLVGGVRSEQGLPRAVGRIFEGRSLRGRGMNVGNARGILLGAQK